MTDPALVGEVMDTPDELGVIANREYQRAQSSVGTAIEHAMACGAALNAIKAQLKHGEFLPWLAVNFDASLIEAQRYMRVARNASRVTHLDSIRAALLAIAPPKEEAPIVDKPEVQPVGEAWVALSSVMDAIAQLAKDYDAAVIASAVPARRRAATAKRLRMSGTDLGRVALMLERTETTS